MKKSVRIAIFTLFSAALFAQEADAPVQVNDLYPLGPAPEEIDPQLQQIQGQTPAALGSPGQKGDPGGGSPHEGVEQDPGQRKDPGRGRQGRFHRLLRIPPDPFPGKQAGESAHGLREQDPEYIGLPGFSAHADPSLFLMERICGQTRRYAQDRTCCEIPFPVMAKPRRSCGHPFSPALGGGFPRPAWGLVPE